MKLTPLIITAAIVIGYNIGAEVLYETGEKSTQRIIFSGILAILVYEVVNYIYKRYIKGQSDN